MTTATNLDLWSDRRQTAQEKLKAILDEKSPELASFSDDPNHLPALEDALLFLRHQRAQWEISFWSVTGCFYLIIEVPAETLRLLVFKKLTQILAGSDLEVTVIPLPKERSCQE